MSAMRGFDFRVMEAENGFVLMAKPGFDNDGMRWEKSYIAPTLEELGKCVIASVVKDMLDEQDRAAEKAAYAKGAGKNPVQAKAVNPAVSPTPGGIHKQLQRVPGPDNNMAYFGFDTTEPAGQQHVIVHMGNGAFREIT